MAGSPVEHATATVSRHARAAIRRELFMLMAWAFAVAAGARWALSPYGAEAATWGAVIVAATLLALALAAYRLKLHRARRYLRAVGTR